MKEALFFILISYCAYSQNYSTNSELLNSGKIKLDSIEVQVFVYKNKIATESYFIKIKRKLIVEYVKQGKLYSIISTRENNSKYSYCYRENVFDFEKGKAVRGDERYYLDQSLDRNSVSFEEVKQYYSKVLNSVFVQNYVTLLFDKIKSF